MAAVPSLLLLLPLCVIDRSIRSAYLTQPCHVEKIEDQFIHTQFFALVDKDGKVRGQVYDGLKQTELDRLKKDIAALLAQKAGTGNFVNGIFSNNPQ